MKKIKIISVLILMLPALIVGSAVLLEYKVNGTKNIMKPYVVNTDNNIERDGVVINKLATLEK